MATNKLDSASPKKSPLPSSDQGRRNIIAAARTAFADLGFEGARLRSISDSAGVLHTAMLYHFKNKNTLWRAVVDDLFAELETRLTEHQQEGPKQFQLEFARQRLRAFIRFSAERPELHRIMTNEGRASSERLTWLVEKHSRRMYDLMKNFTPLIDMPAGLNQPIRLYYAIVGLATAPFTLAPEFKLLSGIDPFSEDELERTAEFVEVLLLRVLNTSKNVF
jgi:TetR/AcrR family transcriptional regulator